MKKYLKILVVFIFAIMLVGCGSNNSKTDDSKTQTGNDKLEIESNESQTGNDNPETNDDKLLKTCTLYGKNNDLGYDLNSTYQVYGNNGIITKVSTKEVVTSDSEEILNYFKSSIELSYKTANSRYGGYTYSTTVSGNKLTSTTTIDYNKMDLKAFVEDNPSLEEYVNSDNKITIEGAIKLYESLGATCD